MTLETDLLVDRQRLKRRLIFWRVFAVGALAAALIAVVGHHRATSGPHIARLAVNGIITDDPSLASAVAAIAHDPSAKALIVDIDSPGGAVAGGEALHDAIEAVARHKPVVAVMGGEAASAGYMIAVPANRIFARQSTLTGSIGVILEAPEFSGLLNKLGITATELVSGPLKGQPNPAAPLTPAGRAYLQGLVNDLFDQFVDLVAAGRHMPKAKVQALADGRAYTGRQALPLGLIDQFGGNHAAREWLAQTHHVAASLPVIDVREHDRFSYLVGTASFPGVVQALISLIFPTRAALDGPLALWQPFLSGSSSQ